MTGMTQPDPYPATGPGSGYGYPQQSPAVPAQPLPPEQLQPPAPPGIDEKGHVRRTKVSAIWIGLIATAIVLIALLIFIAQNSGSVTVHYFGANARVPLAVALLLSAVAGLLIAAIPGTVRILQLRRVVKQTAARR
jgi:uncharacterized integral membrane protein